MPLATQDDVRAALRRELTSTEEEWTDNLIAEAEDLVVGYLHPYQIPDEPPGPIVRVVAAMVAAVLTRPANILPDTTSLTADTYGVQFAAGTTSPGPYLTVAFKQRLDPYRIDSVVVGLASERSDGVVEDAD